MKFLILLGLISFVNSLSDTTSVADDFCDMGKTLCSDGKESIACSFKKDVSMKCDGEMISLNISLILSVHNTYRQKIAKNTYDPIFQGATNMYEMTYSDELAMMASYNARGCTVGHDSCRKTYNFPYAGQNIGVMQKYNAEFDFDTDIQTMMDAWFAEIVDCDMSVINSYYQSGKENGHFTQMVKDYAYKIGCAAIVYENDIYLTLYFVCNYASTNILDEPTYIAGSPGKDCVQKSDTYPSLCVAQSDYIYTYYAGDSPSSSASSSSSSYY